MKCEELNPADLNYAYEYWADRGAFVYKCNEVDEAIAELKDELNRAKAREDVLCTDNRDLLEKTKMLEDRLRENAEHFKRNEAQIIEASDNEIKKLKAENERLKSYIKCLIDRDLIADDPAAESGLELLGEYK